MIKIKQLIIAVFIIYFLPSASALASVSENSALQNKLTFTPRDNVIVSVPEVSLGEFATYEPVIPPEATAEDIKKSKNKWYWFDKKEPKAVVEKKADKEVVWDTEPVKVKKEKKQPRKAKKNKKLIEDSTSDVVVDKVTLPSIEKKIEPEPIISEVEAVKEKTVVEPVVKQAKASKNKAKSDSDKGTSDIDIDSDSVEYFPEKYEIVAKGNVCATLRADGTKLYADKMVYNTDVNTIKGYDNVRLVKKGHEIVGDFINVNMNEENIFVSKPVTESPVYKITAAEGFVHQGQVVTTTGNITLKDNESILLMSPGMNSTYFVPDAKDNDKTFYEKESADPKEKTTIIKAKVIYIKSLKDHDEVTIKNAEYCYKNKKLFTIPRLELTTNKQQDFVETNLPEIGSFKHYGSYLGPGFVLNVPGGATLKLAPVFQMGRDSSEHDYGFGLLGRFHSKNNITEGMWGTVDDMWIVRGQHKLPHNLKLQYAHNGYMDEWFMGMRMPENLLQLVHDKSYYVKDLDATYRNRFTAGYVSDFYRNNLGTMRFRWQTQTTKNFYSNWSEDETVGINIGLVAQTSATVYGTGDFQGVVKAGPYIGTRYKNWKQTVSYMQGATAGESPMLFDQYRYGKANVVIRETLKINKYLTVGYLGSLALLRDNWDKKLFQENSLFVSIGPEDFKFVIGYDPVRERVRLNYLIRLKGGEFDVPYEKMIIDDADTLGKKNKGKKKKKKSEL